MPGHMRQDLYPELFAVEDNHWWHQHKRALVRQWLKKWLPRPGRIIDVGSGTGKILEELKYEGWEVLGVDGAREAIHLSRKRGVEVKQVNLSQSKLPFAANSFNAAICLDTLEHLEDDLGILIEMRRIVKKGGIIIITVPAHPWLFSYWDKMLGHFRRYKKSDLLKLCKRSGLKLINISYLFSFLLLPAIAIRWFKKTLHLQEVSDFTDAPGYTLVMLPLQILGFLERTWLKYANVPLGLSLICVLKKK